MSDFMTLIRARMEHSITVEILAFLLAAVEDDPKVTVPDLLSRARQLEVATQEALNAEERAVLQ
jgi:hypothetical protein